MSTQLNHTEIQTKDNSKELIVVADCIRTPENIGMILRVSEGFGVKKVVFLGDSPDLSNRKVLKTARSTEKEIETVFTENWQKILIQLKEENFTLIGLEITDNSTVLKDFDFKKHPKIALFIGNERNGISAEILNELDFAVHFDLYGKNSSINVVNALSVGLYEILR